MKTVNISLQNLICKAANMKEKVPEIKVDPNNLQDQPYGNNISTLTFRIGVLEEQLSEETAVKRITRKIFTIRT
jgi:hypothetical protein